ncbi:allantoinase AllB [Actinomyces massiliensis]|jgi:allantoinase|uniref:allantoinase n=1 Tax=Actinomyces massiliensis F0489 TaxID=1125718 RepID=J0NNP3_9ACTO|nr:allantoinase AllB [Actinomyces massiliensis]EJF46387.1 allantoinase [Actinomyces massiliensis F0489]WLD71719.1 allantoinase AllB [Actinomyces massiliensis]
MTATTRNTSTSRTDQPIHQLVIRAKRAVFPDGIRPAVVVVDDERITALLEDGAAVEAREEIVVPDDQVLMPGLVDSHVHVNEPGRTPWEGYESATRAGLAGGITTILDMPLNSSPPTTTVDNLDAKEEAAQGKLSVDVGFWGGAVPGNIDQMAPLWDKGVFGFKCFTAHSGIDEYGYLGYEGVKEVLAELAELDAVLIVHAEDSRILAEAPQDITDQYATFLASRPRAAENTAIEQVLAAARETGARVHILHLSSAEALPAIRAAKQEGVKVTVETCPHYLTFASELIPDGATEYKCCPPLRENDNRKALWEGLKDGTIDHIASDHSPCTVDLKVKDTGDFGKAWGGVASVQLGLPAVWTAGEEFGIELSDIARWLAANPCASFRVPGKGSIAVGNAADFAVVAPEETFVVDVEDLEHKNKISPYQGRTLRGVVKRTVLRGRTVDRDSKAGRIVRRP